MKTVWNLCTGVAVICLAVGTAGAATIGFPTNSPAINGDALRSALATAKGGDTIYLAHGAVFEGPFQFSSTAGLYITIRTDIPDCPSTSECLDPFARNANSSVITTARSAGYYHLIGLEITTNYYVANLISLGTASENS